MKALVKQWFVPILCVAVFVCVIAVLATTSISMMLMTTARVMGGG